jgi:hypothetical protein
MVVFLFNAVIYVFLLLCQCILIVCLCIFIVPAGTLQLPWLRVFRAFSSVIRQMPGYNSQRRGTVRILPNIFVFFYVLFVLCRSVYCLCVNVYCTTPTGWQPNCSLTNISYHKTLFIVFTQVQTQPSRQTTPLPPPPILRQSNRVHALIPYNFKSYINIILPSQPISSWWSHRCRFSNKHFQCNSDSLAFCLPVQSSRSS